MVVIKKFNIFDNVFCRICGRLQWLKWCWKMTDAPSDIHCPNVCKNCAPGYKYATKIFIRMVEIHEESRHTPPHLKPKFKPFIVRK